jgi:hypothetical protein
MPKRDRELERAWQRRVTARDSSGLTVRAFCEAEGLAESAFYFWRRELQRRAAERRDWREAANREMRAVEVSDDHPAEPRPPRSSVLSRARFVPVVVDDATAARTPDCVAPLRASTAPAAAARLGAVIELVHPGGVVIRVPADDDAAALRMILGVLDGCATLHERSAEAR